MKSLPTFEEAIDWLLAKHGSNYKVARHLGMTPHNLYRVQREEGTKVLNRTREWIRFKVMEEGYER